MFERIASDDFKSGSCYLPITKHVNEVVIILAHVYPLLNHQSLYQGIGNRAYLGKYYMLIVSTIYFDPGMYIIEHTPNGYEIYMDNEDASMGSQYDDYLMYEIYEETVSRDIDLDEIIVNYNHTTLFQGVDTTHLSKIFGIYLYGIKGTLDVTTHKIVRSQDPKLRRNYCTNKRMLRYKFIQ